MAMCLSCGRQYEPPAGRFMLVCPECAAGLPQISVTTVLIGLNLAVFVVMVLTGVSFFAPTPEQLLRWGASFGPCDLGGEWWRLLSSTFVHIGILHIALNMWCLWNLGRLAERIFGTRTFLVLYLLSGLSGSVLSVLVNPRVIAAGASGAIFGVAGAMLPVLYLRPLPAIQSLQGRLGNLSVGGFVVYNLLAGVTHSGVDNAAHVGGLLTGFVIGLALPVQAAFRGRPHVWRTALVAAGVSIALGLAFTEAHHLHGSVVEFETARALLVAGQTARGIAQLESLLNRWPHDVAARYLLGLAYLDQGRREEAVRALEEVTHAEPNNADYQDGLGIAYVDQRRLPDAARVFERETVLAPHNAAAHAKLGATYLDMGRAADAVAALSQAVALQPDTASYHYLLGQAYLERQTFAPAVAEFNAAIVLAPGDVAAHLQRGAAYALMGRPDSARGDLMRVLTPPLQVSATADQQYRARRLLAGLRLPRFEVLRVGLDAPPRVYRCPAPQYPRAGAGSVGGAVTIEFQVDSLGMAVEKSGRIVSTDDSAFTQAAWEMILHCSYKPGILRGRAASVRVRQTVVFEPPR